MFTKIIIAVIATLGAHAIRLEPETHTKVIEKKEGVGAVLATEQAKKAEAEKKGVFAQVECWDNNCCR